jgi:hypothetical protein
MAGFDGMKALAKAKPGDHLLVRVKVREVGIDGAVWCDNPFAKINGKYAAFSPTPDIVGRQRGSHSVGSAYPTKTIIEKE